MQLLRLLFFVFISFHSFGLVAQETTATPQSEETLGSGDEIIEEEPDGEELGAESDNNIGESIGDYVEVDWDTPQISPRKLKIRSLRLVLLSGTTTPGTEISLPQTSVLTYRSSGESRMYRIIKRDRALLPAKADANGKFIIQLVLPRRVVQVPFELKAPNGVVSRTIFSFKVGKKKVFPIQANQFDAILTELKARYESRTGKKAARASAPIPPPQEQQPATTQDIAQAQAETAPSQPAEKPKDYSGKKLSLSFGAGMSYTTLTEEISSVSADLDFASLNFVSLHGAVDFRIGNIVAEAGGKLAPGAAEAEENSNLIVREPDFNWISGHGRVTFFPEALNTSFANFGVSGSFEYHSLPFLVRVATNVVELDPNDVGFIGFGGGFESDPHATFSYAFNFQYLYPVFAGEIFEIDSSIAFGGGLAAHYRFSPTWALGLYWYGQYVDLTVTQDESGSSRETDITLLHSTLDLRVKFFF